MLSVKRQKRDTPENLYKQCQITGNCLPDVVNKIENKTWADRLLQIFSSIIFLGNLGIGTGKGSPTVGGQVLPTGETIPNTIAPIPGVSRPTIPRTTASRPTRPFSVPLDPIGTGTRPTVVRPVDPSGVRPVDVLDPTSPSIVTFSETLPDNVVTTGDGSLPELNVVTDTTSIISHPTVFQSPDLELAILNVTPADPPPTRVQFTSTTLNPLFPFETTVGHINPDYEIIINPFATTETITYGENIPLGPLRPIQEFDLEDIPTTSTPTNALQRSVSRFRNLYNRNIEQVPTRNVNLLGDVSRAITFGFENPAFDENISLTFEQDVLNVAAAPDTDFSNIIRIGQPIFDSTPGGTVRVSRLGTRAGVRTRSGMIAQQKVHYYYDISKIEQIELPTISSTVSNIVEPITESTIIDATDQTVTIPETDLIDTFSESFNNAQLIINTTDEEGETLSIPVLKNPTSYAPFVATLPNGSSISYPLQNTIIPEIPLIPNMYSAGLSVDYDLHPSLLPRRKRKRSEFL